MQADLCYVFRKHESAFSNTCIALQVQVLLSENQPFSNRKKNYNNTIHVFVYEHNP